MFNLDPNRDARSMRDQLGRLSLAVLDFAIERSQPDAGPRLDDEDRKKLKRVTRSLGRMHEKYMKIVREADAIEIQPEPPIWFGSDGPWEGHEESSQQFANCH